MAAKRLPVFARFIADVRDVWASHADSETRMRMSAPLLERLVCEPSLLAHSKDWPLTVGQNLLCYEDPEFDFVVNAVVRPPGYRGGIHDHAHAWVLYGVMDGTERLERFERIDDGTKPGYAEIRLTRATIGTPGTIDLVPPFAIHAERGGATRSVAMILRSKRLVGRVLQHAYDLAAKSVVERSGPAQVPFELIAAD